MKIKVAWVTTGEGLRGAFFIAEIPHPYKGGCGFEVLWNCYYSHRERRYIPLPVGKDEKPVLVVDKLPSGVEHVECFLDDLPVVIKVLELLTEPQKMGDRIFCG